jgi:hypothetical protein
MRKGSATENARPTPKHQRRTSYIAYPAFRKLSACAATQFWKERAGAPVRSATVVVTYAGCPTAAPHAASSNSTADGGQVAAVSRLNSSGESSWNAKRAEHLADDLHLPRVTQGRRAREDEVCAGERRFGERAHRHGGDVALVDRRRLDRAVRPPDHVTRATLRRPPGDRVRREHPGSKDHRRKPDLAPASAGVNESGSVRSPTTTSRPGGTARGACPAFGPSVGTLSRQRSSGGIA